MERHDNDDAVRCACWIEKMNEAYEFTDKVLNYPVAECGETLLPLRQAVKDARLTVKFSDKKIAEKHDRAFYLREGIISNVIDAAREMNNRGWFMNVQDCFRTTIMQKSLLLQDSVFSRIFKKVVIENNGNIPSAELMQRRLNAIIGTMPATSQHMTGATIDIMVSHAGNLCDLDCGCPYLGASESSMENSSFISKKAAKNRQEIKLLMEKHGFIMHPFKFWQFSIGDTCFEYLKNSGKPARYGAVKFSLAKQKTIPIEYPEIPLCSIDDIEEKFDSAARKLKLK